MVVAKAACWAERLAAMWAASRAARKVGPWGAMWVEQKAALMDVRLVVHLAAVSAAHWAALTAVLWADGWVA